MPATENHPTGLTFQNIPTESCGQRCFMSAL